MARIKALNRYQKAVLIVMGVMILIFTALYFRTISRVGFEYQDTIFVPYQEKPWLFLLLEGQMVPHLFLL